MTTTTNFQPGDEVRLKGGTTGVLYAMTRHATARRNAEGWYFLPDGADAAGLIVVNQPRMISEHDIAAKTGHRAGVWPTDFLTDPIMRQRVYVAHMQHRPLPVSVGG